MPFPLIPNSAFAEQKPILGTQGIALRDRPVFIAEQLETGTPYLQTSWHPYNGALVGDGFTGRLWSFAVDGAVGAVETPNFENGFEYRLTGWDISHNSVSDQTFQVQMRRQSDAGLSAAIPVSVLMAPPGLVSFCMVLTRPRRVARNHLYNNQSFDIGASSAIRNLRLTVTGSSVLIDAGEVILERRRVLG